MVTYIQGVVLSLLSPQPFCPRCYPLSFPFVLPFTYLAPSSCDRNRPPSYQVACRLTLFAPPFTHQPTRSKFPEPHYFNAWQRRHWGHSASTMRNRNACEKLVLKMVYGLEHAPQFYQQVQSKAQYPENSTSRLFHMNLSPKVIWDV